MRDGDRAAAGEDDSDVEIDLESVEDGDQLHNTSDDKTEGRDVIS